MKTVFNHNTTNPKIDISRFGFTCIALPKSLEKIPEYLLPFLDVNTMVNSNMTNGFIILESLGVYTEEVKTTKYKSIEIDDIKMFIEMALKKLLEQNKERIKFSERFKAIIDRYNAGGSENEDYYEQLLELMEQLKKEATRAETEGLSEEELELYDLLIKGKKLTKDEEQKVKLAAKHLFTTLKENKEKLLIVDWYKNEQPTKRVEEVIQVTLDKDLPISYDKPSFDAKTKLILNHFIDMAVQGYGWIVA
jgi:type I restriction enzyme R subunit